MIYMYYYVRYIDTYTYTYMYLLCIINYSWQKLALNITSYVVVRTCQNLSEVVTHCYEFTEYNEYYPTSTAYNNIDNTHSPLSTVVCQKNTHIQKKMCKSLCII